MEANDNLTYTEAWLIILSDIVFEIHVPIGITHFTSLVYINLSKIRIRTAVADFIYIYMQITYHIEPVEYL